MKAHQSLAIAVVIPVTASFTAKASPQRREPSRNILAQTLALSLFFCACAARAEQKPKDKDCLACHSDSTLTTEVNGKQVSLYVDENKLKHSIHGDLFACVDCHKDVKSLVHETTPKKVTCAECHADAQAGLRAQPARQGDKAGQRPGGQLPGLPRRRARDSGCRRCQVAGQSRQHSRHLRPLPRAEVSDGVERRERSALHLLPGKRAWAAIEKGSKKAAVCTDCHGAHEILPANDPKSPIYKFNVPATCGKCHTRDRNRPSCRAFTGRPSRAATGWRRSARIATESTPSRRTSTPTPGLGAEHCAQTPAPAATKACGSRRSSACPETACPAYLDSYHGLASEGGSVVVANCSSCHGVHNILPSSDPRSTINHANLDATCGKCHKGVTQKFTLTTVHLGDGVHPKDIGSIAVRWVRWFYLVLIFVVIGAMFLHNAIIWRSKARTRRAMQNPKMTRMSANQRWQHLILLTSFIVLVITGFALKFPNSWLADVLGMGERAAQHHSPRGGSYPDRRRNLSHLLSGDDQRRPAADSRLCSAAQRRLRCHWNDALLSRT